MPRFPHLSPKPCVIRWGHSVQIWVGVAPPTFAVLMSWGHRGQTLTERVGEGDARSRVRR